MNHFKKLAFYFSLVISFSSCISFAPSNFPSTKTSSPSVETSTANNFPEGFDMASKRTYESAAINTGSGIWLLDDAVVGGAENDQKNGEKAIRIRENGSLTMAFDVPTGIAQISLNCGVYQTDGASVFEVLVSTNGGVSWQKTGLSVGVSEKTLSSKTININKKEPCRIKIQKTEGGVNRLNVDDISIKTYANTNATLPSGNTSLATKDNNLLLGNLSDANEQNPDDFLMVKSGYTLSYNRSKGTANWVAWHLSMAWKGTEVRQNDFRPDVSLPQNWFAAKPSDYRDSGFDRGHLCPSDDRDGSVADNQETFLMSNMIPQAPKNNRGIWKSLEDYARKLATQGHELYVMAGPTGKGGTGENGSVKSLADGKITVPASIWKVIVVLPIGQNDLARINEQTRIIAVNIPNKDSVGSENWSNYRLSVKDLEDITGLNFFMNLPTEIRRILKNKLDTGE